MPSKAPLSTMTIGDFKVTYIPDGGGVVSPTALFPASGEEGWEKHPEYLDDDGRIITTIGGFVIEHGDRKIVVDTGFGPRTIDFPGFGPFSGRDYLENFAKTGLSRKEITDVVFTHMHLDHVGWTTIEVEGERELTFPNADHYVTETEWEFWHGGDDPTGPRPEEEQKPLEGIIEFIEPGDEIVPGLTVLGTPGHTPGHISLKITGPDQVLYLVADILHSSVQFDESDWSVAFDVDAEQARETRENMYDALVQPHVIVAANHFANHVFGRLHRKDGRLSWEPLQ